MIDLIYEHLPPIRRAFQTCEQFARELEEGGWVVTVYHVENQPVGATLTRGPELHFVSFGAGRFPVRLVRAVIGGHLDAHGYMTTHTPKEEAYAGQHRFNQRIGFVVTAEDDYEVHYRLDAKDWRLACPSQQ